MSKKNRPRICFATSMGSYDHARVLDQVLAQALDVRGCDVEFMLCDTALPACQMTKKGRAAPEALARGDEIPFCQKCFALGQENYGPLGLPIRRLNSYLTQEDIDAAARIAASTKAEDIRSFRWHGMPVGDHATAGALRYFARGDLDAEPMGVAVVRRYLEAGLRTIVAMERMIDTHGYDVLVVHHGIYIPQGMIVEVARSKGVRVVTYNPAYRKHSFIFSHGESYHFTMLDEPAEHWNTLHIRPAIREQLRAYMTSRRYGTNDWIWFHDQPREDIRPALEEIGCDPSRPFVTALTSVVWDAQLHYKANAFPNMMEWLIETVRYWGGRTDDLQLVIRVHPAEVRGMVPSRQKVAEELAAAFPELPANVFIVAPENQASTYSLVENAVANIIFNTKTGIEIGWMGAPVIVAGEAWIRGKGFSRDVSSPEDYFRMLDGLPEGVSMSADEKALAERYAYHFFFRRTIPLPFIQQDAGKSAKFHLAIDGAADLVPGLWPGLDTICTGILTGAPFIYPAETLNDPFPGEGVQAAGA